MVGFVQALKRQSGAKDVVIDFKKGTAEAAWRKGARFDYEAVKKTVSKSAELTFRELYLTARGKVTEQDGKPAFRVTDTGELFLLEDDGRSALPKPPGDQVVTLTGRVQAPEKGSKGPLTLIAVPATAGKATR
jgi:hypothetical protein